MMADLFFVLLIVFFILLFVLYGLSYQMAISGSYQGSSWSNGSVVYNDESTIGSEGQTSSGTTLENQERPIFYFDEDYDEASIYPERRG